MTMTFIASGNGDGTNAISFSNIPQTFTHLHLRIWGRSTWTGGNDANLYITVNGNTTSTNYVAHYLIGDGSTASSGAFTSGLGYYVGYHAFPTATATSGIFGIALVDILDYANANKNKVARLIHGNDRNGSGKTGISSSAFLQTSAITSFTIGADIAFAVGSRIDLYGIGVSEQTGA